MLKGYYSSEVVRIEKGETPKYKEAENIHKYFIDCFKWSDLWHIRYIPSASLIYYLINDNPQLYAKFPTTYISQILEVVDYFCNKYPRDINVYTKDYK
jgi:hypothetical protein